MNVELDRKNTYSNNNKAKEEILDLCEEYCMKDIWRIHYGDKREYSWIKSGNLNKASRIDYALVSGGLDHKVKMTQYLAGIMTDHRAFYMVVDLALNERGRGYWKFNNTLLKDKEFLDIMNQELDTTLSLTVNKSATQKWEIMKTRIKKVSTEYARNKGIRRQICHWTTIRDCM